jgi:hypothetical protein
MTKFFQILVIVIALAILSIVGYTSYDYIKQKNSVRFTPIEITPVATTTPSTISVATSTVDTSNWKSYKNEELGYSIKYPDSLITNYDSSKLIIAFPKKDYFHWPLLDDVKLTVIATSTCMKGTASTTDFSINDRLYKIESDTNEAGAGSRWTETVYAISGNGICYKISVNTKGTNGAGFYVDDQTLIKKYDNQHELDSATVKGIIWGILGSFETIKIPEGKLES